MPTALPAQPCKNRLISRSTKFYQFADPPFRPAPLFSIAHTDTTPEPMIQFNGIVVLQSDAEIIHPSVKINTDFSISASHRDAPTAATVRISPDKNMSLPCAIPKAFGTRTFAIGLPSDPSPRRRPCLRLVLLLAFIIMNTYRFSYRGLSPHKLTPMPGVHNRLHGDGGALAIYVGFVHFQSFFFLVCFVH
jgi:hypothetical protein